MMTPQNKINLAILGAIIILSAGLFYTSEAKADAGFYAGVSYSQLDYSESGIDDLDFSTVGGLVGYNLSSSFAIEIRGAKGQSDDSLYGIGVEIDKTMSVLGKFSLPNETNVTPYVIAGYSKGWLKADGGFKGDESDFSYGIGAAFALTDQLSVSAEYASLIDKDDVEVAALSLMAIYTF